MPSKPAIAAYRKGKAAGVDAPGDDDGNRAEARAKYDAAVADAMSARRLPKFAAMSHVSAKQPDLHAAAFG